MVFPFSPRRAAVTLALLCLPGLAIAGLRLDVATALALEQAPTLQAQQQALAGALAARPAVALLPDPRLAVGIENLPASGPDRGQLQRDFMTMQRIGLMQDVPNRGKRQARAAGADARVERERAMLAVTQLAVRREAALAWLAVHFAERHAALLAGLDRENRLLLDTLDARIASGGAMPAERTMARQEALLLADRHDEALRDVAKARAALRRWVGVRADEALEGELVAPVPDAAMLLADLHRHAEIVPYTALQAMARADAGEAEAEQRGDWGWELAYSRRAPQFGDMVSFQLRFDLPWQAARLQQPLLAAKLAEVQRLDAEREDTVRRHREALESQLAELRALDAQHARLQSQGLPLAAERVALTLAGFEAGRGDLGSVLMARREAVEARLRLNALHARRAELQVRLNTLIAEE